MKIIVDIHDSCGYDCSFEDKIEYDKMERTSNALFLRLDADGGGSIDQQEFVDGLMHDKQCWDLFQVVNPIRKLREQFSFLQVGDVKHVD